MVLSIEGHTDNVGSRESNLAISRLRAASVGGYMMSKGFPLANIRTVGYGEDKPLAEARSNSTAVERKMNRRVELRLLDEQTGEKGKGYRITTRSGGTITADFFGISRETGELKYREPGKTMKTMNLDEVVDIMPPSGPAIDVKKLQEVIKVEREKVKVATDPSAGFEIHRRRWNLRYKRRNWRSWTQQP